MSTPTVSGITPTRLALGALGVGGLLWGVWSLLDDGFDALLSLAIWLAGGIIVHDAIVAPLTIGVTMAALRFLPAPARMPTVVAFIVWATCTVAFFAVITGHAGKTGNDTIGDRSYTPAWIVFTLLVVAAAVVASLVRTRRLGSR